MQELKDFFLGLNYELIHEEWGQFEVRKENLIIYIEAIDGRFHLWINDNPVEQSFTSKDELIRYI